MDLADSVVVVTGGARGIGRAFVEAFISRGAKVAVLDLSWEDDEFTRQLSSRPDALQLTANVTDEGQIDEAFRTVLGKFGTVDVLINNAAMLARETPMSGSSVLDTQKADWERMFAVNVFGAVTVTRYFVKPMMEQRRGSVVMVSSPAGTRGGRGAQPYASSKAALTNLASSLAEEMKDFNIAVNVLFPAAARTQGYDDQLHDRMAMGLRFSDQLPVRPETMVPVVLYLAQQDAGGETGQIFRTLEWNESHGLGGKEAWVSAG